MERRDSSHRILHLPSTIECDTASPQRGCCFASEGTMTLITTLPIEDFSPVYVGDTAAIFAPLFLDGTNNTINLTGATLSTRMSMGSTVQVWDSFYWVIDDGPGGKAHRQFQAADVDTAGRWLVEKTITIDGKPNHNEVRRLIILTPG